MNTDAIEIGLKPRGVIELPFEVYLGKHNPPTYMAWLGSQHGESCPTIGLAIESLNEKLKEREKENG